jgi:hypothetical protein
MTNPSQLDVRVTMQSGRILGLTYMDDGFAPTVPCTKQGCYMAAQVIVYEIGVNGRLYRFCPEHVPLSVLEYVRATLQGIQGLSDKS